MLSTRQPGESDPLRAIVRDYVLDDAGKRIRPQLVVWTALAAGRSEADAVVLDVASGWELFHAFLLAHDDIIDHAGVRRSRPSLHRRLAQLEGQSAGTGEHLGIVAGDMLFAASMRLWLSVTSGATDATTASRLLATTGRIAMETGVGQATDIVTASMPLCRVTPEHVLEGYRDKTAAYTFEGPILSGAILAGVDDAACACLSRFAVAVGQAYQVHNDLLDLTAEPHEGCDLMQGKRTLPLVLGYREADESTKAAMARLLADAAPGQAGVAERLAAAGRLRSMLSEIGAVAASHAQCVALLDAAAEAATACEVPRNLQEALRFLLGRLRDGYFR